MECWKMSPEERTTFNDLCHTISKFIEHIAGYLDIGFNPFTTVEGGEERKEEGVKERDEEKILQENNEEDKEEEMGKNGEGKHSAEGERNNQLLKDMWECERQEGEMGD